MKLNKKVFLSAVAVIGLLTAGAAFAQEELVANKVVQPGEAYLGKTYNELVSEWSNWFTKEPLATNPALDPDGGFCNLNQEGRVWFLASTFDGVVDRTCEVPFGKGIFVSLGGAFLSFAPEFPAAGDPCLQMATTEEQVRCDVNNDVPVAPDVTLQATLDGEPITDLLAFRAQSKPGGFTLEVPNPSFLTDLGFAPGDRSPAVADGYFLFLKALKRGRHLLSIRMINAGQETGVDYMLIVRDDH